MAAEPRSAVRRALAEYLRGELGALYSAMTVFDEWPHGQALPDLAVSITVPDVAPELREFPPMVVDFAPGAADTTSTCVAAWLPLIAIEWHLLNQCLRLSRIGTIVSSTTE